MAGIPHLRMLSGADLVVDTQTSAKAAVTVLG
jgi:hypothetical protein